MAGSLSAGTVSLPVKPDTKGFGQVLGKSILGETKTAGEGAGTSIGGALLGGLKRFAGPIAAAVAGFVAVEGIKHAVEASVQAFESAAASTRELQRSIGGTTVQVSGLVAAMNLSGVQTDKAQTALRIFSKNVGQAATDSGKAAKLTKELGFSFRDAHGQTLPMAELLPKVADRFKAMPDGAQKTALAMQLFGKQGTALLPFLNKGSAGIAELTVQAKKMGLVLDDTASNIFVKARVSAREFSLSMQGLKQTAGQDFAVALDGVAVVARAVLVPALQAATKVFAAFRPAFIAVGEIGERVADRVRAAVAPVFDAIASKVAGLAEPLTRGIEGFGRFADAITSRLEPIGRVIASAFSSAGPAVGGLIGPLAQLLSNISPLQLAFRALLPVLPAIAQLLGTLASVLAGSLMSVIRALLPVVAQIASTFTQLASSVIAQVLPVIALLATMLASTLGQVLRQLAPIIAQVASVLGGVLAAAFHALMPVIGLAAQLIGALLPPIAALIGPLLGLLGPILALISPLLRLIGPILTPLIQLFGLLLAPIVRIASVLVSALVPILTVVVTVLANVIAFVVRGVAAFVQFAVGLASSGTAVGAFLRGGQQILGFFAGLGANLARGAAQIGGFFTSLVAAFARGWAQIVAGARAVLTPIIGFVAGVVNTIRSVVTAVVAGIAAVWSRYWTAVGTVVRSILSPIVSFVTSVVNRVRAVVTSVVTAIAALWTREWTVIRTVVTAVWNAIVATVTTVVNRVRAVVTSVVTAIASFWTSTWNRISATVSTVWARIVAFVSTGLSRARALVSTVLAAIGGIFSRTWSSIVSTVSTAVGRLTSAVSTGLGRVVGFFRDLGGRVLSIVAGIGSSLYSAGRSIIQHLIDGIGSMIGAVGNAIGSVMGKIASFLPHSPAPDGPFSGSGWTAIASAGTAISKQLAGGLTDGKAHVEAAMNDLLGGAAPARRLQVAVQQSGAAVDTAGIAGTLTQPVKQTVLHYHAAPNQSFDRETELRNFMTNRVPFLIGA